MLSSMSFRPAGSRVSYVLTPLSTSEAINPSAAAEKVKNWFYFNVETLTNTAEIDTFIADYTSILQSLKTYIDDRPRRPLFISIQNTLLSLHISGSDIKIGIELDTNSMNEGICSRWILLERQSFDTLHNALSQKIAELQYHRDR